ncbi:cupredoxin domain-containing protein [Leucobacter allii]|uniref:cupredoxin domain-containing protein n=1 Tax=Leucobacter allii TaxID=2932247 RepID=UPI001FD5F0A5|nr:cupredoxin domain-containing protein [Leucobacter allii]UOR02144.1 cupredoxin domain-containing protein [Leucobacter allii]
MTAVLSRRGLLHAGAGIFGLGAVAALAGCASGAPEPVPSDDDAQPAVTVRVVDNAFEPAEVEIAVGEAVRWEFSALAEHDVVSGDRSFVSELMREGSYTHRFPEAGEFDYLCSTHPEMRGLVRVVAP